MAKNDKFYTKKEVAIHCRDFLSNYININNENFVEPSAGDGAFIDLFPNLIACDLFPENEKIIKQDFLKLDTSPHQDAVVIGNPPFGKNLPSQSNFLISVLRLQR